MVTLKLFSVGFFLGAGPCMLVCVPVILPYVLAKGSNWLESLKVMLVFSFSRMAAYIILSFISVIAYRFISDTLSNYQLYFKILTGMFIAFTGISLIAGKNTGLPFFCSINKKFTGKIYLNTAVLGFLIGFTPCSPLLGVLTYIAAVSNNALQGAVNGFAFGAGTLLSPVIPVGIIAGLFSRKIVENPKTFNVIRILSGIIIILLGIQFLLMEK